MKYVPKAVTRIAGRSALKLSKHSPTLLVIGGVIGLGGTAVMAARATRGLEPILDQHKKQRAEIGYISKNSEKSVRKEQQRAVLDMYYHTTLSLTKIYGPTLVVGTVSAVSVLSGHNILSRRHIATAAAYSGLMEQFTAYRGRIRQTLGESAELDIYRGARGEWVEDPDHKGEYKLQPKFDTDGNDINFLRPWFDESNANWTRDPYRNYDFLKGVQAHMNSLLQIRGHVFLNDVFDALRIPRSREGQVTGWILNGVGDNYIDFGFMTSNDPNTVAFRNHVEKTVRLDFNVDGEMWNQI